MIICYCYSIPEFINETALTLYPKFGGGHGCIQLSVQHGFFSVINWQIPSRNSGLQAQEHCRPDQTKMSGYLLPSIWWVLSVYLTGRNSHGDCLTISVSVRRALYKVVVKFIQCILFTKNNRILRLEGDQIDNSLTTILFKVLEIFF